MNGDISLMRRFTGLFGALILTALACSNTPSLSGTFVYEKRGKHVPVHRSFEFLTEREVLVDYRHEGIDYMNRCRYSIVGSIVIVRSFNLNLRLILRDDDTLVNPEPSERERKTGIREIVYRRRGLF